MDDPRDEIRETVDDLQPKGSEPEAIDADDATAVRGGRKAGKGQEEYLIVKMDNPVVSQY